jgi:hypothetical protein
MMFALFHYNGDGNQTNRYSLYKRRTTDLCVIIEEVKTGYIDLMYSVLEESNTIPIPTLIKIQKRTGVGTRLTIWWETTWKIKIGGVEVPVLDFLNREFFCVKPFVTLTNDTPRWCELRRQEQLSLFEAMKLRIEDETPRKFPQWILYQTDDREDSRKFSTNVVKVETVSVAVQTQSAPTVTKSKTIPTNILFEGTTPIPGFIAEALVIRGIQKEESCPISMNLYSECNSMVVTNCYHCFDEDSLDEWRQIHRDCPVCKARIHSFVTMDLILG